jgi:hypothetical protein
MRVSKTQKKSKMPVNGPLTRAIGLISGAPFAEIFEQQLQSVRVSYYAESIRNEQRYGAEIRTREDKISELQTKIQEADIRVNTMQEHEVNRLAETKHQREIVSRLQKYVRGLATDHAKLKDATKTLQDERSAVLETQIKALQEEKMTMEREFSKTVEAVGASGRATKRVLDDCYRKLEVSEWTRLSLVAQLQNVTLQYNEEKEKCAKLEREVITSLNTVRHHLEDRNDRLLSKLNDMHRIVCDTSTDQQRAAGIQECIDLLNAMKQTPLMTVEDAKNAEGMMKSLHET